MTADKGTPQPGRRRNRRDTPEVPTGYRASRRGSRSLKEGKRAVRVHRVVEVLDDTARRGRNLVIVAAMALAAAAAIALTLWVAALAVNGIARWQAANERQKAAAVSDRERQSQENLLVIATDEGKPAGFLAVRVDEKERQIFGLAIHESTFIEVPGQGFEPIGESLKVGADASLSAVSNFLGVSFKKYLLVEKPVYDAILKKQSMAGVASVSTESNIGSDDLASMKALLDSIKTENVAIAALPTKPIKLGKRTYFEPQPQEIADLLKQWWGISVTGRDTAIRVIVLNGSGEPGIAGDAAGQLIDAGFRVIDTRNADRFNYRTSRILVQGADTTHGKRAKQALGVGDVIAQDSAQRLADIIIIIGKDYKKPTTSK